MSLNESHTSTETTEEGNKGITSDNGSQTFYSKAVKRKNGCNCGNGNKVSLN